MVQWRGSRFEPPGELRAGCSRYEHARLVAIAGRVMAKGSTGIPRRCISVPRFQCSGGSRVSDWSADAVEEFPALRDARAIGFSGRRNTDRLFFYAPPV